MTAHERRQSILFTLCRRRQETMENFAVEFGVCKRTIENDIMHLSLKYPIYTKSGSGGGVFVLSNFKPDKPSMNKKQIDLLKKLALLLANEDRKTIIEIIEMYG